MMMVLGQGVEDCPEYWLGQPRSMSNGLAYQLPYSAVLALGSLAALKAVELVALWWVGRGP